MKKFLMILGALFLLTLVAVGTFIAYGSREGAALDNESKNFVDMAVPKIVSNWNVAVFDQYADQIAMADAGATRYHMEKLFAWSNSQLGKMVEYQGSKGDSKISYSKDIKRISAQYTATAKFERGVTKIHIELSQNDGVWRISGFHVDVPVASLSQQAVSALKAAEASAPARAKAKQTCEQIMTDFAKKNGADPVRYIAQNQAYLQQCIEHYMH